MERQSTRIKSFSTEGEARQFESVQAEMHIRERELMRRAKRRMSSASATKATVAELLERYAGTLENPTTRSTTTQHAPQPLTAILAATAGALRHLRPCAGLVRSAAPARGGAAHRAPPREHPAGGVRLADPSPPPLSNPLVSLRIAKPKAQRIALPPSVKEAPADDAAAPHIQRVIVLGMATGRA